MKRKEEQKEKTYLKREKSKLKLKQMKIGLKPNRNDQNRILEWEE
jgi:hypothetical protein